MIFNLKDLEMNNYISWVYSILAGYENNGQLGTPKNINVAGEDLDTYLTAGIYTFAQTATPINLPSQNVNGWLVVIPWAVGGTCKQIWLRHGSLGFNDFKVYVRTRISDTWGEWAEVITDKSQLVYQLGVPNGTVTLNTDLNDYIETGEYMCVGTNSATTIANTPTSYNFKLIVEYVTGGFIQQTVIARDGKRWMRTYTISTKAWGDWLCGSLDNISAITMDNNGRLIVTRIDGTKSTFNPDTLI